MAGMFMPALNRTGSLILLLSVMFLAVIMATQLSLGANASAIGARIQAFFEGRVAALKAWRAERRREQQRREVIRKHVEKGTQPEVIAKAEARQKKAAASAVAANAKAGAAAADAGEGAVTGGRVPAIAAKAEALLRRSRPAPTPAPPDDDDDEMMPAAAAASAGAPAVAVAAAAGAAARSKPALNIKTPSLPLPDPEPATKAPAERRKGDYDVAAARAARRPEGRAQDRRTRADGLRTAPRRKMPRVLGRRDRRPDSPWPGRHDLRVQAGRRREVQQDHRPGRRSASR